MPKALYKDDSRPIRKGMHKVYVNMPAEIYIPIRRAASPYINGGMYCFREISRRIVELVEKGLEYERMQASVPGVGPVAEVEVAPQNGNRHSHIGATPVCHGRPMADYGTFWCCMVGQETVPK